MELLYLHSSTIDLLFVIIVSMNRSISPLHGDMLLVWIVTCWEYNYVDYIIIVVWLTEFIGNIFTCLVH